MVRAALITLFVLSAAACGPTAAPCGPTTCLGCCDSSGKCQAGADPFQCGASGSACAACPQGESCSLGVCKQAAMCIPVSCQSLGANCGQALDGCGGTIDCGNCSASGESCGGSGMANVCGPGTCAPKTCATLGYQCGAASDGCGAVLDCGTCSGGAFCGGAGPHQCGSCQPASCTSLGKNCGTVDDGCGNPLSCGNCNGNQTCGGGGTPNVCGNGVCTPTTCTAQGKDCGSIPDNCGAMLACGTCSGFQTCGGNGTANVCGATCELPCPGGFTCDAMGVCSGGNLGGLVLNEVGFAVSGSLQVNGATPAYLNSTYCQASGNFNDQMAVVHFDDAVHGYSASVSVTCSNNFAFDTILPQGTYDVRVTIGSYGTPAYAGINLMPVSYLAQSGLNISAPVTNLVLNEVGFAVSGSLQVNGAAPTYLNATYCQATGNFNDQMAVVHFDDATRGYSASVSVTCSGNFGFNTILPLGTYDVRVTVGSYGTPAYAGINLMPVSYLAQSGLGVSGPVANLVLNEVGFAVSGSLQVNGAAPTYLNATYCQASGNLNDQMAVVHFDDATRGYSASVSVTCSGNFGFNTILPQGTYDVHVTVGSYGTPAYAGINLMPVSYLAQSGLSVSGPVANLVLNEVGFTVSGSLQVNGAAPTYLNASYCQASGNLNDQMAVVHFDDATRGYSASVSVTCSSGFGFSTTLPQGTYDVRVTVGSYGTPSYAGINLMPVSYLAQSALNVSGPVANLVLNEVGFAVSGSLQVNGAAPTYLNATYCQASGNLNDQMAVVHFDDATRGYSASVYITCSSNFAFNTILPQGTYDVHVTIGSYGTPSYAGINLLPVSYLAQSAFNVSGPVANLVLNELGYTAAGVLQVNGAAPTYANPTYCQASGNLNDQMAVVHFDDPTRGYSASVSVTCSSNFGFSTTLPQGVYDVRITIGSYGTAAYAGINLMPVSYLAIERLAVP